MNETDRIEQFKQEIADLKVKTSGQGEQRLLTLSVVMMVVGIVVPAISYYASTNQTQLDQNELIVLSLACVSLTVAGGALFLRYSLARFFRFWLLRQLYEGQTNRDEVLRAVNGRVSNANAAAPRATAPAAAE
jgi:hypothetical protein